MDKKFKRYKVDYASAYRHYIDFGGGRTLEKFCQDEGYDFEKFKRYGRDAFWQHLIYKDDSEYEKQKETVMLTGDVDTPEQNVTEAQSETVLPLKTVNFFKVEFSDGLSFLQRHISGSLSWVFTTRQWRKSSFCPAISGYKVLKSKICYFL